MPRPNRADRLNQNDAYEFYVKKYNNPLKLKSGQYTDIIKAFNIKVVEKILLKGFEFKIPGRLGHIFIGKGSRALVEDSEGNVKRNVFFPPNWDATKKLWARDPAAKERKDIVRFLNQHTDGRVCTLIWHKSRIRVRHALWFKVTLARSAKRRLHRIIMEGEIDQFNIVNYKQKL